MEDGKNDKVNLAHVLFDRFVQASTCKGTFKSFQELCDHLELKPRDYRSFYPKLKSKLNYWKAKALWSKLDKRGSHKDFKKGKACSNTKVSRAGITGVSKIFYVATHFMKVIFETCHIFKSLLVFHLIAIIKKFCKSLSSGHLRFVKTIRK